MSQTCSENRCLNGGKCSQYNLTHVECECSRGFTGPNCENGINKCLKKLKNFCNLMLNFQRCWRMLE